MKVPSVLLNQVPGIVHIFGTYEEPVPYFVKKSKTSPLWKQVHSVRCVKVVKPAQECGEADGFYSYKNGIPISIVSADCVPILLSHEKGETVAAVHAGWRGTYAGILDHLWKILKKKGEHPQEWIAAIGPAIGPCCYEVSEDLVHAFQLKFSGINAKILNPRGRFLDLPAIHEAVLMQIGLKKIDLIRA